MNEAVINAFIWLIIFSWHICTYKHEYVDAFNLGNFLHHARTLLLLEEQKMNGMMIIINNSHLKFQQSLITTSCIDQQFVIYGQ